jgi:hypothetical protein
MLEFAHVLDDPEGRPFGWKGIIKEGKTPRLL